MHPTLHAHLASLVLDDRRRVARPRRTRTENRKPGVREF
jgi:hypothetical protein